MNVYLILKTESPCRNLLKDLPDAVSEWGEESGGEDASEALAVCITDDPEVSRSMMEQGICTIGIEHEDGPASRRNPDAFAVLLDPEEISRSWILLQCCHYYGIPFTVYEDSSLRIRESVPEDYDVLKELLNETFTFSGSERERRDKFNSYTRNAYRTWGFGIWTVLVREEGRDRDQGQDREEGWNREQGRDPGQDREEGLDRDRGRDRGRDREKDQKKDRDEGRDKGRPEFADPDGWMIAGWCGLYPASDDETGNGLEMGYAVLPQLRRRGIAFRAGTAIMRYAEEELKADTVRVRIQKDNKASLQLAGRLGFQACSKDQHFLGAGQTSPKVSTVMEAIF